MVAANNTLPLLEQLELASPCSADWSAMSGDERSRFCGHCQKHVYNLAALTRDEAEALIVAKEGSFCGRLLRRADGTVLTADCPVGALGVRRRLQRAWIGAAVLGMTLLASALHACGFRYSATAVRESGALSRLRDSLNPQVQFMALGGFCIPTVMAPAPAPTTVPPTE